MKFRYKVLIINVILLSLGISIVGYFMINKNYKLALNTQIKTAITENNFIQSTVEYELLDILNSNLYDFSNQLSNVGKDVVLRLSNDNTEVYIVYDGILAYTNSNSNNQYPASLVDTDMGSKNYVITTEDNRQYIYTSSRNIISNKYLNIITKQDISDVYAMVQQQEMYFNYLLLAVVLLCSFFMFIVSYFLTKPLETLNHISSSFGDGDYTVRANIKSNDEVGVLANTYNNMADAVSHHMNELQDMVKRQEQFVADFTHEMKTPMTSIIGYADTIRSKELSNENRILAASYIFSEGKRLEAMSQKLFEFIYTKHNEITPKPFSVGKLFTDVESSVTPALDIKNITLISNCKNCILQGDIELLKSAFINLIDNARKASSENSEIIFLGEIIDDMYQIKVQDYGIGIDKEHLDRICDEFYMVDKSRSRKEGGAGLGLSLASLIFKCHSCDFHIESQLGSGTAITITFPEYQIPKTQREDIDNEKK